MTNRKVLDTNIDDGICSELKLQEHLKHKGLVLVLPTKM